MPRKRTDTVHAGFAARLRDLSVPGPLVKYRASSTHVAPTPAECGRPSGRTVATKNARSGCGVSLARMSRGRLHGSSGDPYRSRLRVEIGSVMVSVIPVRRTGDRNRHPNDEDRPSQLNTPSRLDLVAPTHEHLAEVGISPSSQIGRILADLDLK